MGPTFGSFGGEMKPALLSVQGRLTNFEGAYT